VSGGLFGFYGNSFNGVFEDFDAIEAVLPLFHRCDLFLGRGIDKCPQYQQSENEKETYNMITLHVLFYLNK